MTQDLVVEVRIKGTEPVAGNVISNWIKRSLYYLDFEGPWEISVNGSVVDEGPGKVTPDVTIATPDGSRP
jgi:hypothetical protein